MTQPQTREGYTLSLLAPAKLNLFLHINGQRQDGYHELQTLFQILDRGDVLHFRSNNSGQIKLAPQFDDIADADNLIVKAAKALQAYSQVQLGADIYLDKYLPMGGGVGGGSSDAATTLLALNHIWGLQLSRDTLAQIGLQLGADVPVFVHGRSAFAEGVGEQLIDVSLPENWFVIVHPGCHVSTAKIFSNKLLTRDTQKITIAPASEGQLLKQLIDKGKNDCEVVAKSLFPEIDEALNWLKKFGSSYMTGTGACCFCRANSEAEAQQILAEIQPKFEGFIAKGVNLSPAIKRLDEANSLQ